MNVPLSNPVSLFVYLVRQCLHSLTPTFDDFFYESVPLMC